MGQIQARVLPIYVRISVTSYGFESLHDSMSVFFHLVGIFAYMLV